MAAGNFGTYRKRVHDEQDDDDAGDDDDSDGDEDEVTPPRVFLTKTVAETALEPGLRLGQRQARWNDDDDGDDDVVLVCSKHKNNTVTRDREAAHDNNDGLRRGSKIKSVPADLDYKLPVA